MAARIRSDTEYQTHYFEKLLAEEGRWLELLLLRGGPWTPEDLLVVPPDSEIGRGLELVDGVLLASPIGSARHQRLIGRIFRQLDDAVPAEYEATVELNLLIPPNTLLIPDFTVVRRTGFDGVLFPAQDVLLVGEVVSPTGRVNDTVLKREVYAKAGIPYYLVVEPLTDSVRLTLLRLTGDEYRVAAVTEDGRLDLAEPFEVHLDLPG